MVVTVAPDSLSGTTDLSFLRIFVIKLYQVNKGRTGSAGLS